MVLKGVSWRRKGLAKDSISFTCSSTRSNPLIAHWPSPILPIIAEKVHQEKLKAVKARLNFEEASRHSESGTPSRKRSLKERLGPRRAYSIPGSPEPRHGRSKSLRDKDPKRRTVFRRLEKGVFHRLRDKEKNVSAHSRNSRHMSYHSSRRDTESCYQSSHSRETEIASEKHHHKEHPRKERKHC
ncbi:hypothetical protein Tco_1122389 [Tanacetum coccineum]|uniref:Uncharacterized protein n=1 Tax=Tanacetum coccineum TaxID=301880 RepID=A0ABQ5J0L9_9ASTR